MKYIKRLTAALLAIIICLSFASCGKKDKEANKETIESQTPQQKLEAAVENTKILSVSNNNKKTVSLGDTAEAVQKAFGEPDSSGKYSLRYDGATVYLSDTVNMITVNGEGYTGYADAHIGKSLDEFKKKVKEEEYFAEEQKDIGFFRMTFAADENGEIIKNPDETDTVTAPYLFIVTSDNYGADGTITHIQLKDNRNK